MNDIVMDNVFGAMMYKHRWIKEEVVVLLGKEWHVKIVAKAYSGKPITMQQQEAYKWFCENLKENDIIIFENTSKYINSHNLEFAQYWDGARNIKTVKELADIITLKTILFTQDGAVQILCECPWDENGIAIQLRPTIEVGGQDMFL